MKNAFIVVIAIGTSACATLTSDPMTPIALSFSDGSVGICQLMNKRGDWSVKLPSTASVRRSDDPLKYECKTQDGRESVGQLASTVGAKIVASAVFIDFGITDAITDKHREYPASFVVPVKPKGGDNAPSNSDGTTSGKDATDEGVDVYDRLRKLDDLRQKGILTDEEFELEKKKLLADD